MRKKLKNHFIPHEGNDYKPHFVRGKSLVAIALVALAFYGLAFSIKSVVVKHPDLLSAVITSVLVDLTNSNRLSENLSPLEESATLVRAAQLKADDMAGKSYFAHTSPEGVTPWYWFKESGYTFVYAGENLAVNFTDSEDVVRAWMSSPGHRANILNGKFTQTGIAMASGLYNGRQTIYVVQLFGRPANQEVALSVIETETVPTEPSEISEIEEPSVSVAGAESENVQVLAENKMFLAVQNNDYLDEASTTDSSEVAPEKSSIVEKTLASPKTALKFVYLVIGAIVLIALILFVSMGSKRRHPKNIIYVLLLLFLLAILLYLSSTYLFPRILIE